MGTVSVEADCALSSADVAPLKMLKNPAQMLYVVQIVISRHGSGRALSQATLEPSPALVSTSYMRAGMSLSVERVWKLVEAPAVSRWENARGM